MPKRLWAPTPLPPILFAVSGHFFLRFHACENTKCFEWFCILCSDDQSEFWISFYSIVAITIWFQHFLELEAALLTQHRSGLTTEIPTVQAIQNWQVLTTDRNAPHTRIHKLCDVYVDAFFYMHLYALVLTREHLSFAHAMLRYEIPHGPFADPCSHETWGLSWAASGSKDNMETGGRRAFFEIHGFNSHRG